jgi:ubiquinone biosynthesis protein COQ4
MKNDTTGRLLLQEKPVIHKTTIPYERLIQEAEEAAAAAEDDLAGITFGQAYGIFLKTHGFDPDARDAVKYIQDDELAYVMLRYRQVRRLQACST